MPKWEPLTPEEFEEAAYGPHPNGSIWPFYQRALATIAALRGDHCPKCWNPVERHTVLRYSYFECPKCRAQLFMGSCGFEVNDPPQELR